MGGSVCWAFRDEIAFDKPFFNLPRTRIIMFKIGLGRPTNGCNRGPFSGDARYRLFTVIHARRGRRRGERLPNNAAL